MKELFGSGPVIVVELGINHRGDLDYAKHLCLLASSAGAKFVKNQTHIPDAEMSPEATSVVPPGQEASIFEIIKENSMSMDDEIRLKEYCDSLGLTYFSTPFSVEAAHFLEDLGVPLFKVGSGECDNFALLEFLVRTGKPLIVSTGMRALRDIEEQLEFLVSTVKDLAILETTNSYPCSPHSVSLGGIRELKTKFPEIPIGYSDHTVGMAFVYAALGAGAGVIEKHFTDDLNAQGPDIKGSMDVSMLAELVKLAPEISASLARNKSLKAAEHGVLEFARGTLCAAVDLVEGTTLCKEHVTSKRPGTGDFFWSDLDNILGATMLSSVKAGNRFLRHHFVKSD